MSNSEINPEYLKPENDHYLRIAYAATFAKWLRDNKLTDTQETWRRYKACSYGRFAE